MDKALLLWINQDWAALPIAPWLDTFFGWVSQRGGFAFPILSLLLLLFAARHRRDGLWLWLTLIVAIGLGDACGNVIKHLSDQARPCYDLFEQVRQPGRAAGVPCGGNLEALPSNHALNFFLAATFVWLSLRLRPLTVALFVIAALVGISRIYLGKHYPSQVLAGALLGMLLGYIAARIGLKYGTFMQRIRATGTDKGND